MPAEFPKAGERDTVNVLGVAFDTLTIAEAIKLITTVAADPQSRPAYVVKPYVEFLDAAAKSSDVAALLSGAALSLPDGIAPIWAAHYLYAGPRTPARFISSLVSIPLRPAPLFWPLPERIGGINFTMPLLEEAARLKLSVALIGSPGHGDIARTAHYLSTHVSGLKICAALDGRDRASNPGTVNTDWTDDVARKLTSARADIILVGMGFPLQERVMADLAGRLGHGVMIGEGGSFDFTAFGGTRPKAPRLIQRLNIEWLWRLILQPSRITRQLAVPRVIYRVWRSR